MNKWKLFRKRKTGCEEGQSILELALTFPVILLLICAVVDFGRAIDALIIVTNAAREGARHASVDPSLSIADVQTLVKNEVQGSGTNVTTLSDFGESDLDSQVQVTYGADAVTVAVTYDFQLWFGGIVGMDTLQIHKQAVMPIY